MFFAPLLVALVLPSQRQPPRDPMVSPGIVLDAPAREAALVKQIAAFPAGITAYPHLAGLQEERGAYARHAGAGDHDCHGQFHAAVNRVEEESGVHNEGTRVTKTNEDS